MCFNFQFRYTTPSLVVSTPGVRSDLFRRNVDKVSWYCFFSSRYHYAMYFRTYIDKIFVVLYSNNFYCATDL